MRTKFLPLIAITFFAAGLLRAADQPNIVFFLSDDQRSDMLGCAGHEFIQTPHIDKLAKGGTRFENMFVTTSICAASRATCFTGLYERTHKYTFGTPALAEKYIAASYPVLLKKAGYQTGFVGKFGVGVHKGATGDMFDFFRPLNRNPYMKTLKDGTKRHLSDIAGDKAIEFLETTKADRPFCLSVSFNAVHAEDSDKNHQYTGPDWTRDMYVKDDIPAAPLSDPKIFESQPKFLKESMNRDRWFWRWDTKEKYQRNIREYYRMISGMDAVVGRVVKHINDMGRGDNTVVLFAGDNGYYAASRGFAGKWSHYEESLRVPLIIRDPRVAEAKQGQVLPYMVLNVDIAPTILNLAGVKLPAHYQGVSLAGLVRGDVYKTWRNDFFCEHLMHHPDIPKWEGVRGSRWVYARYFEQEPEFEFLHDLKNDPQQLKNLATDPGYADELAAARKRMNVLRDKWGDEYSADEFPSRRRK